MSRTGPYDETWQMPDFVSGPRYSQSLARGLAIMECFKPGRSVLGIADIADELGDEPFHDASLPDDAGRARIHGAGQKSPKYQACRCGSPIWGCPR